MFKALSILAVLGWSQTWAKPFPVPRPINAQDWIRDDDYPAAALREDISGVVALTVSVDASGNPVDCQITKSSGSSLLDETTCQLIKSRARFVPAAGSDSQPVPGKFSTRVRWEIPSNMNAVPAPGDRTISFIVERDGSVSECTVNGENRPDVYQSVCRATSAMHYMPATNSKGDVVRRKVIVRTIVKTVDLSD